MNMPVLFSVRRTRSHCRTVIFKGLGNLPTSKKMPLYIQRHCLQNLSGIPDSRKVWVGYSFGGFLQFFYCKCFIMRLLKSVDVKQQIRSIHINQHPRLLCSEFLLINFLSIRIYNEILCCFLCLFSEQRIL